MTFSIVARDPATGDLGVAVQSKFLAVGAVVPWARAGVGAVATQAFANLSYGPDGLALLASGLTASEATSRLVAADVDREHRQLGVVDAAGRAATHTGRGCFAWAGGRVADNVAVQGNILAGPAVVDALFDTFTGDGAAFPTRLVRCLAAADAAGGDRRGRQSAALLVVREGGAYGGRGDRWIDLRVDDASDPIAELGRLLELWSLYFGRPRPETCSRWTSTWRQSCGAASRPPGSIPAERPRCMPRCTTTRRPSRRHRRSASRVPSRPGGMAPGRPRWSTG